MRLIIFCLAFLPYSFVAKSQEYYKAIVIKPDSVEQGIVQFLYQLQQNTTSRSSEAARLYRDSIASALAISDTVFRDGKNFEPVKLDRLLPRRSFKLLSDLLWQEFTLASDKVGSIARLQVLSKKYPLEEFIQGNLSLAYSMIDNNDSAAAVITRYLAHKPDGYLPIHLASSILKHRANEQHKEIVNLGADSFAKWTAEKMYNYPAPLDSLRNALAITLSHRSSAFTVPEKITGRLVLDFADLTVKDKRYTAALPFYEIATVYDPSLRSLVAERKSVIAEAEKSVNDTFRWASIFYAIPLLSFVLILVSWLRSKRKPPHQT